MKYYIIAGEASGDLHASNLIRELKNGDPLAEFRCWGGDLMQAQGANIVKHYRDLAFMGFLEVLLNLRAILGNLKFCKVDIQQFKPDAVILVDYPGFNLRIARFVHKLKIPVIYYISPQIWAWKQSRVKIIRKVVDKMLVILPFEKDFYARHKVEVEFTGHPLLDALARKQVMPLNTGDEKPVVALLPGSRSQEIKKVLPVMLEVAEHFKEVKFVIAGVPSLGEEFYHQFEVHQDVQVIMNRTYDLLSHAKAALVTSGTATLETALIGTPEVVCYKGGYLSYLIARQLIKIKYISLVNLIMDRLVVKELIQHDLNVRQLTDELNALLYNDEYRTKMLDDYHELSIKLGGVGASAKAAEVILNFIKTKPAQA